MSAMTNHERPGVYSAYEVSSIISGSAAGAVVGLAAVSTGGTPGELVLLGGFDEAVSRFGAADLLTQLSKLLFLGGASAVAAVPVTENKYEDAFAVLNQREDVKIIVCDSDNLTVQQTLRDSVEEASALRKEKVAVVCGGKNETAVQLVLRAAGLNSERVVLAAPEAGGDAGGPALAAAVAGALAGGTDPAVPLGGAVLKGIHEVTRSYSETALDTLIRGGVTVTECVAGETMVVRGVTTRTTTGGSPDATWRELTTILIVDHVIPAIRNSLRSRFNRAKNTQQVRSAIRSQVILELEEKVAREIIAGYGEVTATALADNPTVCLVEFSFAVAHGLNQIWISAKITV